MFLPHLKAASSEITPLVLLPGDSGRVFLIGSQLKDFRVLRRNREFMLGVGTYGEIPITVCSTGIGGPSTAIVAEELITAGAQVLVRVGTCGGAWRSDIPVGSLIIPTACVRDEGTTGEYIPKEFPAAADFEVVSALVRSAQKNQLQYFAGINRTHDAFYGTQESILRWGSYLGETQWEGTDTPILSSDMETSVLFVIASLRGRKAGAVLAVNAYPEPLLERITSGVRLVTAETDEMTTRSVVQSAINVALDAIVTLGVWKK